MAGILAQRGEKLPPNNNDRWFISDRPTRRRPAAAAQSGQGQRGDKRQAGRPAAAAAAGPAVWRRGREEGLARRARARLDDDSPIPKAVARRRRRKWSHSSTALATAKAQGRQQAAVAAVVVAYTPRKEGGREGGVSLAMEKEGGCDGHERRGEREGEGEEKADFASLLWRERGRTRSAKEEAREDGERTNDAAAKERRERRVRKKPESGEERGKKMWAKKRIEGETGATDEAAVT